jgi:hypothetical protein
MVTGPPLKNHLFHRHHKKKAVQLGDSGTADSVSPTPIRTRSGLNNGKLNRCFVAFATSSVVVLIKSQENHVSSFVTCRI